MTFEALWSEKYAALHAAAVAEESARRSEDFLDLPRFVCGLPLRVMTPRDLLMLDGVGHPLVCGGEVRAGAIAQFLFMLHDQPPVGWLSRRRFFRHCGRLDFAAALAEVTAYRDRIFADQPRGGGGSGRPIGTSFLAPLIVRLASQMSLRPAEIMDTPLPQLFQYQKVLAHQERGSAFKDYSASDRVLSECLAEHNRLQAEAPANS